MKKLWKWLDGKKTVFGLTILQAVQLPFIAANPTLALIFQIAGAALTGIGVAHKAVKPGDPPTPK